MKHPAEDVDDRSVVWDALQYFWMDTDPAALLRGIARICAGSKYSLAELEAIFWNEVRPAVAFNLRIPTAPEWAGFDSEWLIARVLATHRFGKPLPWRWRHRDSQRCWETLRGAVVALRG